MPNVVLANDGTNSIGPVELNGTSSGSVHAAQTEPALRSLTSLVGDQIGEGLNLVASLGEVVDIEVGEHYSTHGVQCQHQAPGDYDENGFRIVVKHRD